LETLDQVLKAIPEIESLHHGIELPDSQSGEFNHVLSSEDKPLQASLHDLHVFSGYGASFDLSL
jgi:hypothetical protein